MPGPLASSAGAALLSPAASVAKGMLPRPLFSSGHHCSLHIRGDEIKWSQEKLQVGQVSGDSLNYYACRELKVDVGLPHTSKDMKFRF